MEPVQACEHAGVIKFGEEAKRDVTRPILLTTLIITQLVLVSATPYNEIVTFAITNAISFAFGIFVILICIEHNEYKKYRKRQTGRGFGNKKATGHLDKALRLDHTLLTWNPPNPKPPPFTQVLIKLPILDVGDWVVSEAYWDDIEKYWMFGAEETLLPDIGTDVLAWTLPPRGRLLYDA